MIAYTCLNREHEICTGSSCSNNMGGSNSRGGIHINLENPNVLAGSEITGLVHLIVKEATPAYGLELLLKGKETTHWVTGSGKNTHHYYGTRKFLRWEIPLFVFSEGRLQPGHYGFPFAVLIPGSIPGTFNFGGGGRGSHNPSARINYKLKAQIIGEKAGIQKGTIPLVISQTTYAIDGATRMENTARLSTWCCSGKGEEGIKAETDKMTYITGETAIAVMTAESQNSDLESKGFRASLIRTIIMRDNHGNSHVFVNVVSKADLPHSIPIHHPTPVTQSLTLPITSDSNQTNTVQGQLIQCKYDIRCEVVMKGWCMCCGQTPAVEKHVVICPSTIPRMEPPPLPEDWKGLVRTF